MKERWVAIALAVLVVTLPGHVSAQGGAAETILLSGGAPDNLTSLSTGTRVRVDAPRFNLSSWRPIVGTFEGERAGTLEVKGTVAGEGQPRLIAIPTSSIDGIQRWNGRKGNGRVGMVVGMVVAASVAALTASNENDPSGIGFHNNRLGATVVGGLGGILWGGLVGSQIKTDRWEKVPLGAGQ